MPALQRGAAWAEERLLGFLRQSVPPKRPRPFAHYRLSEPEKTSVETYSGKIPWGSCKIFQQEPPQYFEEKVSCWQPFNAEEEKQRGVHISVPPRRVQNIILGDPLG